MEVLAHVTHLNGWEYEVYGYFNNYRLKDDYVHRFSRRLLIYIPQLFSDQILTIKLIT